jgi:hypothetical protein
MQLVKIPSAVGVLLALTFVPAYAGQKGKSGSHGPAATTHRPTTTHAPKTTHGPSTTTHGRAATGASAKPVKAPKPTTTTKGATKLAKPTKSATKLAKPTKSATKLAKADTSSTTSAKSKKAGSKTTTASTGTTPTSGTTTTIDFTAGKVGSKLSSNTALRSKLESRLTALGYEGTAYQAAYGFKNLGQFMAATNVSQNLGISFDQLKVLMTGLSVQADGTVLRANLGADGKVTMVAPADVTTPAPTKSLGQAIQTVKSTVDPTAAAQAATTQADADIQSTSTTTVRK